MKRAWTGKCPLCPDSRPLPLQSPRAAADSPGPRTPACSASAQGPTALRCPSPQPDRPPRWCWRPSRSPCAIPAALSAKFAAASLATGKLARTNSLEPDELVPCSRQTCEDPGLCATHRGHRESVCHQAVQQGHDYAAGPVESSATDDTQGEKLRMNGPEKRPQGRRPRAEQPFWSRSSCALASRRVTTGILLDRRLAARALTSGRRRRA